VLNDDEEGDGGGRWCVQEGPALDVLDAYGEAHDRRLFITDEDEVEDMRYRGDGRELRLFITHKGSAHYLDIDQYGIPDFDRFVNKYEDKTIFRLGCKSPEHQEGVLKYLEGQEEVGSIFAFPEREPGIICALNREDFPERHFYVYDVFQDKQIRKVMKEDVPAEVLSASGASDSQFANIDPETDFQTDAFDIDPKGRILVYAYGRILKFQSVGVPESIKKHMAPNFRVSEHKYSPARVQETKFQMKERIDRDIRNYNLLGHNKTLSNKDTVKQTILKLMTLKYNEMCENKRIIQGNDEFLTMARILLKEEQPECPVIGIQ